MSTIEPYRGSNLSGVGRQTGRAIARIDAGTSVRQARLEAEVELQASTVDALAYVGRRALQDVALLSQVEQQLALAVPMASGRLAAIADLMAVALSQVVADASYRLRRS